MNHALLMGEFHSIDRNTLHIKVDGETFPVTVWGNLPEQINDLQAGTPIAIKGKLTYIDGNFSIVAERVSVIRLEKEGGENIGQYC